MYMYVGNTLHQTQHSDVHNSMWLYNCRQYSSGKTDERVSTMKEVISAMKVIKMHTWETAFLKVIQSLRM